MSNEQTLWLKSRGLKLCQKMVSGQFPSKIDKTNQIQKCSISGTNTKNRWWGLIILTYISIFPGILSKYDV